MGCVSSHVVTNGSNQRYRKLSKKPAHGGHAEVLTWKDEIVKPNAWSFEGLVDLGWRRMALAAKPLNEPVAVMTDAESEAFQTEKVSLREKVAEYLGSSEIVNGVLSPEIIGSFIKSDADWSPFVYGCLKRVKDVNMLGGPRMQVVWWGSLKAMRRIPMWPIDASHVLDAEWLLERWTEEMDEHGKVGGRGFCVSAFSHRWERPGLDARTAHPDSPEHKKAAALAAYGENGTCPIFEPNHMFDYYFWVDFAGVNQLDVREKQLGVCKLPAFISVSTEIIMYNSSTTDYEPRAWTRAERALGFTFTASPLFVYMDDNYPNEDLDLDKIVADNPRCFMKDDETGALKLIMRDPCGDGAYTTDPRDKELLDELTLLMQKAVPLNPQRIASGMNELDFGRASILLDTEHYSIDCAATMARRISQQSFFTSWTRSEGHTSSAIGEVAVPVKMMKSSETSSTGDAEGPSDVMAGTAPTDILLTKFAQQELPGIKHL